jgi:hypothetical protein
LIQSATEFRVLVLNSAQVRARNLKGTMVIWHRKSEPPASITGTGDRAIDAMTGGAVPDAHVEMKAISAFPRLGRGKMRLSL